MSERPPMPAVLAEFVAAILQALVQEVKRNPDPERLLRETLERENQRAE